MGESSNRSGKIGEEKAKRLLPRMGWLNLLEGHGIKCFRSSHITDKGSKKQSHGIDFLYAMNNPFHDNRTDVIVVSVKHTIGIYPNSDQQIKKAFGSYLEDLQQTLECSERDSGVQSYIDSSAPKKNKELVGLLFWLQSDNEKFNFQNMKQKLQNAEISSDYKYPVYLIDNHSYGFVESVLDDMDSQKSKKHYQSYKFYSPSILGATTAISVSENRVNNILPLELLAAGVLIFHVVENNLSQTLVIYTTSCFTEENYRTMLAYAFSFFDAGYQKVSIGMLGYNDARHDQCALKAQKVFEDRDVECEVFAYHPNQKMGAYKIEEDDHE